MKSLAKLKDEARRHEQQEDWAKAIDVYVQVLRIGNEGEGEAELPLYNRVGDLLLRLNRPADAVKYYEDAADLYAEAGLYNNAIALCNKALRYDPERSELLRKLAFFSASQGFLTDARRWYLEYAEKMFRQGGIGEAVKALDEFAGLNDDPAVREILGRKLRDMGRTDDAVAELRQAYLLRTAAGESDAAAALRAEILALDPQATDLDGGAVPASPGAASPPAVTDSGLPGLAEFTLDTGEPDDAGAAGAAEAADDLRLETTTFDPAAAEDLGVAPLSGLESGFPGDEQADSGDDSAALAGLEATDLADPGVGSAADGVLEAGPIEIDETGTADFDLPMLDTESGVEDEPEDDAFDLPLLDSAAAGMADAEDADLPILATEPDRADDEAGEADDDAFELPLLDFDTEPEPRASGGETGAGLSSIAGIDLNSFALGFDEETEVREVEPEPEPAGPRDDVEPAEMDDFDLDGMLIGDLDLSQSAAAEAEAKPQEPAVTDLVFGETGSAELSDVEAVEAVSSETAGAEPEPVEAEAIGAEPTESEPVESEPVESEPVEPAAVEPAAVEPEPVESEPVESELAARAPAEPEPFDWEATEPESVEVEAAGAEPESVEAEAAGAEPDDDGAEAFDAYLSGTSQPEPVRPAPSAPKSTVPQEGFVDLGAMLTEDDEAGETTRFRVAEAEPTGDEDQDFAELLAHFKAKIAENIDEADAGSHYDLGLAYKEMGLVEEAIGQFQIALRAGDGRLRIYEELGHCFFLTGHHSVAIKVLRRALDTDVADELELIGVYYYLGRAYEEVGQHDAARDAYERVLALEVSFQDVGQRLARL